MSMLEIGFARCDITPDQERQTIYHRAGRKVDNSTPIRDRLYARATVFKSGDQAVALVTLDMLTVAAPFRARVTARLAGHGVPPEQVVLCATHTHTAPTGVNFRGVEAMPESYVSLLESKGVEVVLSALQSAELAEIAFGKTTANLNVNRREIGRMADINDLNAPTGNVDDDVTVARIRIAKDGHTAWLFNYAAHPLTMKCADGPQISADYPGRAVAHLESAGGADFAQFLQGCAGNLNVKISGGEAEAVRAGRLLADAVLAAGEALEPSGSSDLRGAIETVRIPWERIPTLEEARAALETEEAAGPQKAGAPLRLLEWARALVATIEKGDVNPCAEVLVQAVRIGDAVFVALPGEVFMEIGKALKRRSGVKHLFVVGYANTCEIGYIPTAAAFPDGGYEVDGAPCYYGLFKLSPDCERIMVEAGLSVIRRVI